MLADVDCLVAYPVHTNQLMKSSLPLTAGGQFKRRSEDFTVHGANRVSELWNPLSVKTVFERVWMCYLRVVVLVVCVWVGGWQGTWSAWW